MDASHLRSAFWPSVTAALAAMLLLAAPADAALRAAVSLSSSAGKVRLVVKLTSTKKLTARTRPRSVKVKVGGKTYVLAKARGAVAARTYSAGTWRSAAYSGKAGAALSALAGKSVSVKVITRAGTNSIRSTVPNPNTGTGGGGGTPGGGGGGGGAGTTPLFEAPGRQLEGQDAVPFLQRYFVNSRFTDCPAGWPACAVEERYNHCADGSWEYHRLTPTSGSDINSYGTFSVTGARVNPDGSWIVEYNETAYGATHFYHWEVATNGRVLGTYDNNAAEPLGPLQWQQPAGCGG